MKKLAIAAAALLFGTASAWAQMDVPKTNQINWGLETSYIQYTESSIDVEEKGVMVNLFGDYDFRPGGNIIDVYHLDGRVGIGSVDYKGSGDIDNILDYTVEPRFWIGKDFNISSAGAVTPYVGFGYRLLADDLSDKTSSTGAAGYFRLSQYLYAPVGVQLKTQVNGWQLGLTGEYDIFIQGWQKSYLSDVSSGLPDITNRQKKGYGLRGSIDVVKKGQTVDLSFSPFVRFWHIEQSETTTASGSLFQVTGYEPENKSLEVGLKVAVGF